MPNFFLRGGKPDFNLHFNLSYLINLIYLFYLPTKMLTGFDGPILVIACCLLYPV